MDAEKIIKLLDLKPHPGEGGFYRETHRSDERIAAGALPARYVADKHFSTAIYYLLTHESFSAMHRIPTDEIFHFYLGDPVTMLQLYPQDRRGTARRAPTDGDCGEIITLGHDIEVGQSLQVIVPRGVWQGMSLNEGGRFALMGTTVAPAFDFEEFELGDRGALVEKYPEYSTLIERLTLKYRSLHK